MTSSPAEPGRPADLSTVEQVVRAQLAKALGGRRGILEGAVPTALFTILFLTTHDLRLSLVVSVAVAVLAVVMRLAQRSTVQFALNALFGIAIAAVFAARAAGGDGTPEDAARAFFTPGILYNAAYAAVLVLTIAVRWPLVGFLVGSVAGDPTAWHRDRPLVRLCSTLTWILAAPCILRVAVQGPLWLDHQVGLLGASKIAMGWPLQVAAFAAMGWVLSRNSTPADAGTLDALTVDETPGEERAR